MSASAAVTLTLLTVANAHEASKRLLEKELASVDAAGRALAIAVWSQKAHESLRSRRVDAVIAAGGQRMANGEVKIVNDAAAMAKFNEAMIPIHAEAVDGKDAPAALTYADLAGVRMSPADYSFLETCGFLKKE
jgi:hypothetical protein